MGKREGYVLFYFCAFIIGVTLGSAAGLGSSPRQVEFSAEALKSAYILSAFAANLPFWCCVFIPQSPFCRLAAGGLALLVKGSFIGCTSVYIFSVLERSAYFYSLNILPQLLTAVPALILMLAYFPQREGGAYTYSTILTNLFLAVLATFFISCIQFLFFFVFAQFN